MEILCILAIHQNRAAFDREIVTTIRRDDIYVFSYAICSAPRYVRTSLLSMGTQTSTSGGCFRLEASKDSQQTKAACFRLQGLVLWGLTTRFSKRSTRFLHQVKQPWLYIHMMTLIDINKACYFPLQHTCADSTTDATVLLTSAFPMFLKRSSKCAWRIHAILVSPSLRSRKQNKRQTIGHGTISARNKKATRPPLLPQHGLVLSLDTQAFAGTMHAWAPRAARKWQANSWQPYKHKQSDSCHAVGV